MDDNNQKERLEQELRFLKESFEAEVISKEECEKGKERVENKLKDIEISANKNLEGPAKIAEKNKLTFTTEVAAISAGYTLAGNCTK